MVIRRQGSPVYYTNFVLGGSRIRRSTGTDDKELAEQYEAELKRQLWKAKRLGERPPRSWKEAVVRYAEQKAHKRTLDQDIDRLDKLTPTLGELPLHAITDDDVTRAIKAYQSAALKKNGHKWKADRAGGPATRNRYRSVVRTLLTLAATRWRWIDAAPVILNEYEPHEEARWLTPQEAERLLASCTGPRAHWHAPVALALSTGLRAGNIFKMEWRWVDLTRRVVIVPRRAAKSGRAMPIPLNAYAEAVIRAQLGKHPERVITRDGKPTNGICPARFKAHCKSLGIERATFHSLRHTWAAWHIMSGTPLYDVMVMGGWTSLQMLSKTYGHLSVEHLAESAQRIVGTKLVTLTSVPVECAPQGVEV